MIREIRKSRLGNGEGLASMHEPILKLSHNRARELAGQPWTIDGQTYRFVGFNPSSPGQPPWKTGAEGLAFPLTDGAGRIALYAKFFKSKNQKRFDRTVWLTRRNIHRQGPALAAAPMLWADSRSIGRPGGVDFDITACCAQAVPGETWKELKYRIHNQSVVFPDSIRWRCIKNLVTAAAALEEIKVVHGDLSDNNVIIDVQAAPHLPALYVIDFDAFVALDAPHLTLAVEDGGTYGTEGYHPPDLAERVASGDRSAAPYSDRHGRDMLLLELLLYSGRFPPDEPPAQWLGDSHLQRLCEAARARCPQGLLATIEHLQLPTVLYLSEANRPSSVGLLGRAGPSIAPPVPTPPRPVARPHPTTTAAARPGPRPPRPAPRPLAPAVKPWWRARALRVVLAAAVVLLAVYLGWHWFSAPGRPARQAGKQTPVAKESVLAPASRPAAGQNLVVADLGMEMVYVEPGSFQMGSNSGDSDEKPVHAVRISRAFWMDKYEVTQSQYEAITGRNPSSFKGLNLPVDSVSWNDAVAFCRTLTDRERKAGRLPQGYVYRLPTEAEWEYAARGGSKSRGFEYAGSGSLDEVAWHSGNSGSKTHPVGQKNANELGLYDMSGNVWEWCHDSYDEGYYAKSPSSDPTGASSGGLRVLRGGSWLIIPWYCRASIRFRISPDCIVHQPRVSGGGVVALGLI